MMTLDEAREFLRNHHRAVLATHRQDGGLQLSPVLVGVDPEGRVIISTREPAFKTKNMRRQPQVSLCVFTNAFFGEWIQVEGEAKVVSLPDALEPLVDYYRTVVGEHPDWADYRAAMAREQRVLVRISITRVGPQRHG